MAQNVRLHTLHRSLILLLCIIPGYTWALGLGDIMLRSTPETPLKAKIKLLAIRPEELKDLHAGLASHRDFEWVGIRRTRTLDQLKFSQPVTEGDSTYILVNSETPIQQSTLNFLVEVKWQGKRLLREYTIELRPPETISIPQTIPASVPNSSETMTTSAEHASNTEIALQTDSESFRTKPVKQRTSDASVTDSKTSRQPIVYTSSPGDTLAIIAKRFLPDKSINLAQMMIIIQKTNPKAFIKGNINGLKSNITLRIPSQNEVNQISPTQAITEVKQHNKLWQNKSQESRNRSTAIKTVRSDEPTLVKDAVNHVAAENKTEEADKLDEKIPEVKNGAVEMVTEEDENPPPNPINNGQLELMSEQNPSTDSGAYTIAPKEYIENLERSANLTQELAESRRLETEEVKGRIQRLESVISQQKRLITLQTEQLQALNERVRMMAQNNKTPERVHWQWFSIWALTVALGLLLFFFTYKKHHKK